jgi:UDP-glucuronate 4-epimerase
MSTILVTGGAGFIGSHFIEQLLATTADDVICVDNLDGFYDPALKRANAAAWLSNRRVRLVEHDFGDMAAMVLLIERQAVRRIVHLGALPGVSPSVRAPLAYQQTNVGGTLALLEAARETRIDRFLLVSSSTVYGKGAAAPFQEDGPLGVPASPYGATKRAAELLGLTYHQLHGLPVVCLRPFSVYGPRLRPDLALARFAAAIWQGEPITLFGDGSALRDFTYVDDICAGLRAALDRPGIEGEAINLGCGRPIEMREVITALEHALGRRACVRRAAPRPEDLELTFADIRKARRLLGYEPRVSFETGVARYANWFVEQQSRPPCAAPTKTGVHHEFVA